ncbi:MAG: VWA domain-containing protein [Pseudomonadota bacterium]
MVAHRPPEGLDAHGAAPAVPTPDEALSAGLTLSLSAPAVFGGLILRGPRTEGRDRILASLQDAVRLPIHVDIERLIGGLDLSATLSAGSPRQLRGLLASGVGPVIVPSAERLGAQTAGLLALLLDGALAGPHGEPIAPRPLIVLDEAEGDDPPLDPRLLERIALILPADIRAHAPPTIARLPQDWRHTPLHDETINELLTAALLFGVPSIRTSNQLCAAAKALAALDGHGVSPQVAQFAAALVLGPRAIPRQEVEPAPLPEEAQQPGPSDGEDDGQNLTQAGELRERVVEAVDAALDSDLFSIVGAAASQRGPQGRAGRTKKGGRGRPAGVKRGRPGRDGRIALVETLTAALPWRRLRGGPEDTIPVRQSDLRVRRTKSKSATLTVFCVDASGSQAFSRMAEAKGAVERLLAKAYVRRDEVALIAFRKDGSEVLLPPTSSLTRAKRALAALPGGGGTPLAAGLQSALRLCLSAGAQGREPTLVVLTDGRANVRLSGEGGRSEAMAEAEATARQVRAAGVAAVVVDTSPRPGKAAAHLAEAMGARYAPLRQFGDGLDAAARPLGAPS